MNSFRVFTWGPSRDFLSWDSSSDSVRISRRTLKRLYSNFSSDSSRDFYCYSFGILSGVTPGIFFPGFFVWFLQGFIPEFSQRFLPKYLGGFPQRFLSGSIPKSPRFLQGFFIRNFPLITPEIPFWIPPQYHLSIRPRIPLGIIHRIPYFNFMIGFWGSRDSSQNFSRLFHGISSGISTGIYSPGMPPEISPEIMPKIHCKIHARILHGLFL